MNFFFFFKYAVRSVLDMRSNIQTEGKSQVWLVHITETLQVSFLDTNPADVLCFHFFLFFFAETFGYFLRHHHCPTGVTVPNMI